MKTLAYSPFVEAYVAASDNGAVRYYDVSEDIVAGSITRNQDATSTFDLSLANKNGKYNGKFMPMDRIVIYLAKEYGKGKKVLTGYISTVSAWTLYPQDFRMSGRCSLYRLQRLYWDPGLSESETLMKRDVFDSKKWKGIGGEVEKMLTKVGGWPRDAISIGDIPDSVITWAKSLYATKVTDIQQAKDLSGQFYKMLSESGPAASGFVSVEGGGNSSATSARPRSGNFRDGADYFQVQKNGVNCGATAFTVCLNMILGLKGSGAFDNLAVWNSPSFGCDSTVNLAGKGRSFIAAQGLSSKVEMFDTSMPDATAPQQLKQELQSGHLVILSSGAAAHFLRTDGSYATYEGHFIMFYNYSNGTYFCNDSSSALGGGVPYSAADIQQFFNGRPGHHTPIIVRAKR